MRWLGAASLSAAMTLIANAQETPNQTHTLEANAMAVLPTGDEIGVSQAYTLASSKAVTLIDVRRAREWKSTGMAEGAIGVTLQDRDFVDQIIAAVNGEKSQPIALICRSGRRSATAQKRLRAAGFTHVMNVEGGTLAWKKQDLPMQASSPNQ